VIFWGTVPICHLLKIPHPAALWYAGLLLLPTLWLPVLKGVLQGQHKFAGLGWLQILEGIGRLGAIGIGVLLLRSQASGAIFAVLAGLSITTIWGAWLNRQVWLHKSAIRFDWRRWVGLVVPLTMGLGSVILMYTLDTLFVQSLFYDPHARSFYIGAMFTGFAMFQFIAPVTLVMFPKIVHSIAHSEKTDALKLTVAVAAGFGCLAAVGCTIFPKLPIELIFFRSPEMWPASRLVPWFAWAYLPLILANVLISNLLAHKRFQAAPWLLVVPVIFGLTMLLLSPILLGQKDFFFAFELLIVTLGLFNLLLFGVASWFTWRRPAKGFSDLAPGAAH
jgi:uncharacterized membrane protein YvlD (DUF360 family)